jgi:hypothetical protein
MRHASARHEHALVELVAVAENFSTTRLLDLAPTINEAEVGTWPGRNNSWRNLFQIHIEDPTAFPEWPRVRGFVEARNAIQHGLGTLTRRQLQPARRAETFSALAVAGINLSGNRVVVSEESVTDCYQSCSDFVVNLDRMAPIP